MKTDQESESEHTKKLHVKASLTTLEFASFCYLSLPTDIPEVECRQIQIYFFARVTYEVPKICKDYNEMEVERPNDVSGSITNS